MSTTYYISGGSDNWIATKAKTLRGAKTIAMRTYQQAVGGKIEIGVSVHTPAYEMGNSIDRVAVRYGYDNWSDAP